MINMEPKDVAEVDEAVTIGVEPGAAAGCEK